MDDYEARTIKIPPVPEAKPDPFPPAISERAALESGITEPEPSNKPEIPENKMGIRTPTQILLSAIDKILLTLIGVLIVTILVVLGFGMFQEACDVGYGQDFGCKISDDGFHDGHFDWDEVFWPNGK